MLRAGRSAWAGPRAQHRVLTHGCIFAGPRGAGKAVWWRCFCPFCRGARTRRAARVARVGLPADARGVSTGVSAPVWRPATEPAARRAHGRAVAAKGRASRPLSVAGFWPSRADARVVREGIAPVDRSRRPAGRAPHLLPRARHRAEARRVRRPGDRLDSFGQPDSRNREAARVEGPVRRRAHPVACATDVALSAQSARRPSPSRPARA